MGMRTLSISSALLLDLFAPGPHPSYSIVHDAVPPDAYIIEATYSPHGPMDGSNGLHHYGYITLLLASPSWPPADPPAHLEPVVAAITTSATTHPEES